MGFSYDSAATKDEHALLGDKGLIPNIPMSSSDDANSTTKSGVANGTIELTNKDKQKQDISTLNRDTNNTLNKLGEIFDKDTVQERQELAGLFGELAYNEIHKLAEKNGWKDGSAEKNALHAAVGGIMSKLTGSGFISGASGAMVNEMVQNELKKIDDPALHQWASAAVGATISSIVTGNAQIGASTAASGTKNNVLNQTQYDFYVDRLENESESRNSKGTIINIYNATKEQDDAQQLNLINALNDNGFCERLDEALINNPELNTFEGIVVYGKDIHGNIIDARDSKNRINIINKDTALLDTIAQNIVTSVPAAGKSYLEQQTMNVKNIESLSASPMYKALKKAGKTVDIIVFGGNIYTDLTSYDNWQDRTIAIVCDAGAIGIGKAGGAISGAIVGTATANPVVVAIGSYTGAVAGGPLGAEISSKLKNKYINIKNRGN